MTLIKRKTKKKMKRLFMNGGNVISTIENDKHKLAISSADDVKKDWIKTHFVFETQPLSQPNSVEVNTFEDWKDKIIDINLTVLQKTENIENDKFFDQFHIYPHTVVQMIIDVLSGQNESKQNMFGNWKDLSF